MKNNLIAFLFFTSFSGTALATEHSVSSQPKAPNIDVCDFVDLERCD